MPIRQSLAVVFASLGIALAAAAPAFGHAAVIETVPSNRSDVSDITEVSVTANEEMLDIGDNGTGFVFTVRDAANHFFGDGCVTVDGDTASMPLVLTEAGRYRVSYRIVSNDGHPIEGSYSFRFAGTDSVEPAPAFTERPRCGVPQEPIAAIEPTPADTAPVEVQPTEEPAPPSDDFDLTPWIGIAGVALVGGAIWLLIRALGRSDSEDDLV
jgi:methionine-rich copper-binding protein CopC